MKSKASVFEGLNEAEGHLSALLEEAEEQKRQTIHSVRKTTRRKAKEVIEAPEDESGRQVVERIDKLRLFVKLIRNLKLNQHMFDKRNGMELRINQIRGIQKLIEFLEHEGYGDMLGYFKQPTGAGKTVLFGIIAKLLDVKTLILVPRTNLLTQTKNELVGMVGIPEDEIGIVGGGNNELGKKYTIATYQSHVSKMRKGGSYRDEQEQSELVICDEAHRSLGESVQESIAALDSEIDESISEEEEQDEREVLSNLGTYTSKKALKLGFTATPTLAKKQLSEYFHFMISEEKQSELVKAGILVGYRIVHATGEVSEDEIEQYINEEQEIEIIRREQVYQKLLGEYSQMLGAYKKTKRKERYPLRGIAFCPNIAECDVFKKEAELLGLRCQIITGREASGKHGTQVIESAQERIMHNEIDLIVTVAKLGEGWNFPPANAAIWARAINSPMTIIQGVGRIGRSYTDPKHRKKEYAYIFETDWLVQAKGRKRVPKRPMRFADALASNGENPEEICSMADGSKLNYEARFTLEGQWQEMFRKLVAWRETHPDKWPSMGGKDAEEVELAKWSSSRRKDLKDDRLTPERKAQLEGIGFPWSLESEQWKVMYGQLQAFREAHPDSWPSSSSKDRVEAKLGVWCNTRRKDYREENLEEEEIAQLNALGFPWNPEQEQWDGMFEKLKAFREANKDRWPSMHAEDEEERSLAKWCSRQRQNKKKKGGLDDARIVKMDSLSFDWNPTENWWEEKVGQLQTFISDNGRYPSQQTADSYERNLAMWCVKQRTAYRRNELEKGAVEALNAIGFKWEVFEDRWTQILERLKVFRQSHPDSWPSRYSEDESERELANWCNHRRSEHKRGDLAPERKEALDALGFEWELKRGPKAKN